MRQPDPIERRSTPVMTTRASDTTPETTSASAPAPAVATTHRTARFATFHVAQSSIVIAAFALPTLAVAAAVTAIPSGWVRLAILAVAPPAWLVLFSLACGMLSVPFRASVRPGTFPRDLADATYRGRRLYGLCWTLLYYLPAAYHLVLAVPLLKWAVFRLFGYRGPMNFTLYPDTWIRDLPLLEIGEGAYLSNKATLGTNMPLMDGRILVDRVRVGRDAYVGHLAMIAAGSSLGDGSETGAGSAIGIRVRIGDGVRTSTGPVVMDHHARVGDGVAFGTRAYVGKRAVVGAGVVVPEGLVIPGSFKARSSADVERLMASGASRGAGAGVEAEA